MKALKKNVFREIQKTKSRFISILAIIALSTGFFTGVKASSPSMIETGRKYFEDNNLMDIRLVSSVGFDDEDIQKIKEQKNTVDVMPGYTADLIMTKNNIDTVVKVYSLPEKTQTNDKLINEPTLVEGRLPKNEGECVIESYFYNVSDYKIGDTIKFNEKMQNSNTQDIIKNLAYKIVGVVSSPVHITYQRGNTTVGDGSVSFFIMIPSDEFVSERYTNVYLTTSASEEKLTPFGDEYKNRIESQIKDYEELSEERIKNFNDTTLSDAQKKLSDAKKEYSEKKEEAEKKINDGAKKLHDSEQELNDKLLDAEKKLSDGEQELENGKKELEKAQEEYSVGIEDSKEKLKEAEEQYNSGQEEYRKAKLKYDTEIEKAQSELDSAQTEYYTQYSLFYGTTKPQAEAKLSLVETGTSLCKEGIQKAEERIKELEKNITLEDEAKKEWDELKKKIQEYKDKLKEYETMAKEGRKQLKDGEKQLGDAKDKLDKAKSDFQDGKINGAEQLNNAQIQLDNAQSQLEIGRLEYNTAMTTGMLQLQSAQTKITSSEKELENGRKELYEQKEKGMLALKEAREKLTTGKAEAKKQLSEAEEKLKNAENTISKLNEAKWYVYGRDDNPGYSGLEEDAQRVDNIATVFPVFFLIVAALVCLTTMTRMVEERRTEIGTLKALGYSNRAIAAKYFIYAASAAVLGSIIGAAIGLATLPYIILDTYSMMYTLPATILVIPWESFLFSAGTGLLCTCLVSVIACLKELKIRPATLMRPKSPKPGKRILLEYIPFLWKHMNFTSKVTARNLFRYKARFFMTVIGVAGCTALIIGGLGLKDSIGVIADRQYKEITIYDQIYALSESGTSKEKSYIMSQFHNDERISESLLVSQNWTTVKYGKNNKISLRIIIGENKKQLEKMFILRDRNTHEKIRLDENGVVINERLSQVIGAKLGDNIDFTINDAPYHCKISGITENYAGNCMYMTPAMYQKLTNKETEYNTVYTQIAEDAKENEKDIANDWMGNDDIITVSLLNEQLESITSTLDSLNVIVFVLIICAGLLAIVVLYNLTNINIAERVREIATIKVLGFYNGETANYIYRENTVLTLVGAAVGLPIGTLFTSFIVQAIQMDMVMFPQQVNFISYIIGFALTLAFSLFVNFIMYFKMNKISMVESLKSIE